MISSLNIADNRIGNDGLSVIAAALNKDCVLIILNLANNDLEGVTPMEHLNRYLASTRNLLELNLSSNRLGDLAMAKLSEVFHNNSCQIQRIGLQNCQITAHGAGQLFEGIRMSLHLK